MSPLHLESMTSQSADYGVSLEFHASGRIWATPLVPCVDHNGTEQYGPGRNTSQQQAEVTDWERKEVQFKDMIDEVGRKQRIPCSRVVGMSRDGHKLYLRARLVVPALYLFTVFGEVLDWKDWQQQQQKQCQLLVWAFRDIESERNKLLGKESKLQKRREYHKRKMAEKAKETETLEAENSSDGEAEEHVLDESEEDSGNVDNESDPSHSDDEHDSTLLGQLRELKRRLCDKAIRKRRKAKVWYTTI